MTNVEALFVCGQFEVQDILQQELNLVNPWCMFGHYQGDEDIFRLFLNNGPAIEVPYESPSGLPIGYARTRATPEPQGNMILTDENKNLTYYSTGIIDLHISTSLEYNNSFAMSLS
jgi:hypothetical protein